MKRFLSILVLFVLVFAGNTPATVVQAADTQAVTIEAQGNPYHIDFVAASSKHADLRINLAKKGLNAAFTDWLKAERPEAYRQAAAAALASHSSAKTASAQCCAKSGQCCQSNCAQCCAKGQCRMSCCEMTICKASYLSCCK